MEKKVIPGLEIIFQDDLPESQLALTHMFWSQSLEEILADINFLVLLCKKWELYPHEMKQPEWRPYFIYDNPQWYTFSEKMEGYGKLCSLLAEVCKARGLDPSPLNNLASQFISTIMPAMAEDKRRWLDAQYQWINMANDVKPLVFQLKLRLASELPQKAQTTSSGDLHDEGSASLKPVQNLTDTEKNILQALGDKTMVGRTLLAKAGYENSSHYRNVLSGLCKRNIIENLGNHKGYRKVGH